MSLALAHRDLGGTGNPPLVVLHGLLGSSRNWMGVGKSLVEKFHVLALDLRNHGDSPHSDKMTYEEMSEDVVDWMEKQGLKKVHLLGHSLGGKVAMRTACDHPEKILSLTVVDISVREYPPRWEREFALLRAMPIAEMKSRKEAEEYLEPEISDWAFRQFLISNLVRVDGQFRWQVNLSVLEENLGNFFHRMPDKEETYRGKVLFIKGGKSRFIPVDDIPMIKEHFPDLRFVTIEGAGHNVHFEQPEAFVSAVFDQLKIL